MPGFSVIAMFRLTRLYLAMPDDAAAAIWLSSERESETEIGLYKVFD
jgi:hypothetical protein